MRAVTLDVWMRSEPPDQEDSPSHVVFCLECASVAVIYLYCSQAVPHTPPGDGLNIASYQV